MTDVTENMNEVRPDVIEREDGLFVDNATDEKPDHFNARARILLDGLSVFGFNPNPNMKRAEVGFFRHEHSPVEMKIYKNGCNLIFSTSDRTHFPHGSTDNIKIIINSGKPNMMGSRYESGVSDPEDFRVTPNPGTWYGVPALEVTPDTHNHHLSARLYVQDAIFYTHRLSKGAATKKTKIGGVTVNNNRLYPVGRGVGGDIFCASNENIEIIIKIPNSDGSYVDFPLQPLDGAGNRYEIVVKTIADNDKNHLHHIFNVLNIPRGDVRKFDFEFDLSEPALRVCGGAYKMAGQYACETLPGGNGGW